MTFASSWKRASEMKPGAGRDEVEIRPALRIERQTRVSSSESWRGVVGSDRREGERVNERKEKVVLRRIRTRGAEVVCGERKKASNN